ncbi:MAG: hypothetical protein M1825_005399 [Sarcosagium campestre]|nr:MAG: hypothetical protein M1825_005399 [Sarcosagium campestre]
MSFTSSRKTPPLVNDDESSDGDKIESRGKPEIEVVITTPRKTRRPSLSNSLPTPLASSQGPHEYSKSRRGRNAQYMDDSDTDPGRPHRSSGRNRESVGLLNVCGDDSMEDEDVATHPTAELQNSKAEETRGNPRLASSTNVEEGEQRPAEHVDLSSEEDSILSPSKRRRLYLGATPARRPRELQMNDSPSDENEEDEDIVLPSARRNTSFKYDQKGVDLADDLEILDESNVKSSRTRLGGSARKMTSKQRQLERLRRRRTMKTNAIAGISSEPVSSVDSHTDHSNEDNSDTTGVESDSGLDHVRQALRADGRQSDNDIDDFIADDDDDTLGAPEAVLAEIPYELTRHAHKKPKEHFKDAIEWMVQKKINPGFARDDPVYLAAFKRLDDEVKGYSSSRFTSTAWRSEFKRALQARPILSQTDFGSGLDDRCQACNRSNHPPKFEIRFEGSPYDPHTLEDVSDDDGHGSGSSSRSVDHHGNALASSDTTWLVGRFCMANAESAHTLEHWRWSLNDWVVDYLSQAGYMGPEQIVERDSWTTKRKSTYANSIVDAMKEDGQIDELYRDYKINMETIKNSKPPRFRDE